jgi:hypothetical protein
MRELGPTAIKLRETYDNYSTRKEAAEALGVSTMRVFVLGKKLNITKWDMPLRRPETAAKLNTFICENCKEEFHVRKYSRSPHRFCSKKCQGQALAKKCGFGVKR